MPTLLIADGDATAHALTAALALGSDVHILEPTAPVVAEALAEAILALAPGYDAIVAPATSTGKNVLPRVAALLDVMQVSDIIAVVAPDTFRRPTDAGNAIETVQATDATTVITVRAAAFPPTPTDGIPRVSADNLNSPLSRVVGESGSEFGGHSREPPLTEIE